MHLSRPPAANEHVGGANGDPDRPDPAAHAGLGRFNGSALAQWAADRKAAKLAVRAARAARAARAPQRRAAGSSEPWTFGEVLTGWEVRHRDGVQASTLRDYGPALNDLRQALGGVLARSLTDEHFEAYKRAELDGVDLTGGDVPVRKLASATVNTRLDLARRVIREAIRRGVMSGSNPVDEVVRPRSPKREQLVLSESDMRRLIDAADRLELRAIVRCFAELALRFSEATGFPSLPTTLASTRCAFASRRPSNASGGILREPNFLRDRWRPLLRRAGFEQSAAGGATRPGAARPGPSMRACRRAAGQLDPAAPPTPEPARIAPRRRSASTPPSRGRTPHPGPSPMTWKATGATKVPNLVFGESGDRRSHIEANRDPASIDERLDNRIHTRPLYGATIRCPSGDACVPPVGCAEPGHGCSALEAPAR